MPQQGLTSAGSDARKVGLPTRNGRSGLKVSTMGPARTGDNSMEQDVRMLARLFEEVADYDLSGYVLNWMQLSERHRKEWSYIGGLFSREESDPIHDFGENTFDPGNWY